MKLKYVYTVSWFPRTKLHLREIYNVLKYRATEIGLDSMKLAEVIEGMKISSVEYQGGFFDKVVAQAEGVQIEYEEDGLLLVKSAAKDWPADSVKLEKFYQDGLTPFLNLLFSRGAPSLEIIRAGVRVRPIVVVATQMAEDEIEPFFKVASDKVHSQVIRKGLSVYFGDKVILIIAAKPDSEVVEYLVRLYSFFREYEAYLYRFMLVDRKIWDRINGIRGNRSLKGQDLPELRDQLILFKRDVNVIKLRLNQMDNYFDERRRDIETRKLRPILETYKAFRFDKMASIQEYMVELMQTTEKYVDDAINLLQLLYQENQQREISTLQVIFLMGTVANFVVLGTLSFSQLQFFDVKNNPIGSGTLSAVFDVHGLLIFGSAAIIVSLVFFLAWHYVFKRIRLHRAISLLEKPGDHDPKKIFKDF